LACSTCRRRKIKCSGQSPCGGCTSFGLICEYAGAGKDSVITELRKKNNSRNCQKINLNLRNDSTPTLNIPMTSYPLLITQAALSSAKDAIYPALEIGIAIVAETEGKHRPPTLKRSSPPRNCYARTSRTSIVPMRCRGRTRW
jgi:hypothetical protein